MPSKPWFREEYHKWGAGLMNPHRIRIGERERVGRGRSPLFPQTPVLSLCKRERERAVAGGPCSTLEKLEGRERESKEKKRRRRRRRQPAVRGPRERPIRGGTRRFWIRGREKSS